LDWEHQQKARLLTFYEIYDELALQTPLYYKLESQLNNELAQRSKAQEGYQAEMQQGFVDDEVFNALQEKRLKAGAIAGELSDQEDKTFMSQLNGEWKEQQAQTKRGRALNSIAANHADIARFQQLRQVIPAASLADR
jgi:hypothetical protein